MRRYGFLVPLGFMGLVVWAFWPTYYSDPSQQQWTILHVHGVAMTAWCAALLLQASLVRVGQPLLHRYLGWLLLPLFAINVLLQIETVRRRAGQMEFLWNFGSLADAGFVFLAQTLLGTALFALFFAMAFLYRKRPAVHGGLMLCTLLPILFPVTDRIVNHSFPSFGAALPELAGVAHVSLVSWVIADAVLIGLAVCYWRRQSAPGPFVLALGLMLGYQLFCSVAHEMLYWRIFCDWLLDVHSFRDWT